MKKSEILATACALAVICLSLSSARAATLTAASAASTDVAVAIAAASSGDTVQIPAGRSTWPSPITVNKPITIAGAGTNLTIITGKAFYMEPKADALTRLTGVQFAQPDWGNSYIVTLIGNCKMFRVDHCLFVRGSSVVNSWGTGTGPAYGVIDHNVFIDCNRAIFPTDSETTDGGITGASAWNRGFSGAFAPGTTNSLVIEDNMFLTDAQVTDIANNNNQMLYGQYGTRATFRYNTMTSTGGNPEFLDAHGAAPGSWRGTMLYEVYNNTFQNDTFGYGFFFLRGGCHLIYSNSIVSTSTSQDALIQINNEETGSTIDLFTNAFFWGNTLNGAAWSAPLASRPSPFFPPGAENSAYFMHPPTSTTAFFPYIPLVYPHPLVSGTGASGTSTNPVISLSSSSLNFGTVLVGSTNDLTITVRNVGAGTLSGSASVSAPFSILGTASYSLGSNQSRVITLRYVPTTARTDSQTATFSGGGGASVSATGVAVTALSGLSFESTSGAISAPFTTNPDGTVSQSVLTTDPTQGGRAAYVFNITAAGEYTVSANILAPNDGANSFFVNIDAEPNSNMTWLIPVTTVFTTRFVTWGTSTDPQVWTLGAGTHQLIVRGREGGAELGHIDISPVPAPPLNLRRIASN